MNLNNRLLLDIHIPSGYEISMNVLFNVTKMLGVC